MSHESSILIVAFEPRHAQVFDDLNVAWVERFFEMEDKDCLLLERAQEKIIDNGGHVLIAEEKLCGGGRVRNLSPL